MKYLVEITNDQYKIFDACYGEVIGRCHTGIYLMLENHQYAFAYNYTSLPAGSRVLCSVNRKAHNKKHMLVTIDSVFQYVLMAA